jgi:hypothetical protein
MTDTSRIPPDAVPGTPEPPEWWQDDRMVVVPTGDDGQPDPDAAIVLREEPPPPRIMEVEPQPEAGEDDMSVRDRVAAAKDLKEQPAMPPEIPVEQRALLGDEDAERRVRLNALTVEDLQAHARTLEVEGRSKLDKDGLVDALVEAEKRAAAPSDDPDE